VRWIASSLALLAMTKWCADGNNEARWSSESKNNEQRGLHAAGRHALRAALSLCAQLGAPRGGCVRPRAADVLHLGDEGRCVARDVEGEIVALHDALPGIPARTSARCAGDLDRGFAAGRAGYRSG